MRAVIVEDDIKVSENLLSAIKRVKPALKIVDICKNAPDAIFAINSFHPDLVFLDVVLENNMTAFDILENFKELDFKIIFTTAYQEHALAAFEYNAVAFLLKPYSDDKLKHAIEKAEVITIGEQGRRIEGLKATNKFMDRHTDILTFICGQGEYLVRNCNDIIFLEADGPYVKIYFKEDNDECSTNKTLSDYESILKQRGFIRVHQKYLVNINFIKRYTKPSRIALTTDDCEKGAGGCIVLLNNKKLPVSRLYANDLKAALNIF